MAFLAGYGIVVNPSSERFVGRMLDGLAKKHNYSPQTLTGPLNCNLHGKKQQYSQVSFYASTIRKACVTLRSNNFL